MEYANRREAHGFAQALPLHAPCVGSIWDDVRSKGCRDGMHRVRRYTPPHNNGKQPNQLPVIPFGQLRRNRGQITQQPSGAMVWSRREVDLCGGRGGGIAVIRADISLAECPDSING